MTHCYTYISYKYRENTCKFTSTVCSKDLLLCYAGSSTLNRYELNSQLPTGRAGFDFRQEQGPFLFATASVPALSSTQSAIHPRG